MQFTIKACLSIKELVRIAYININWKLPNITS